MKRLAKFLHDGFWIIVLFGMLVLWLLGMALDYTLGWFVGLRWDEEGKNPFGHFFWPYKTNLKSTYEVPSWAVFNRLAPWEFTLPIAAGLWWALSGNRAADTVWLLTTTASLTSLTLTWWKGGKSLVEWRSANYRGSQRRRVA